MSACTHPIGLEEFAGLMAHLTARIEDKVVDRNLEVDLNRLFLGDGTEYKAVLSACEAACTAGWMCTREARGIRYGRVIKPGPATHGFSVDVVDMQPVAGSYHEHPNGEVDLIMPLSPDARFDGHGAGWLVYGPGSAHTPTVTGGRALVLYLLPGGAIEFTGR